MHFHTLLFDGAFTEMSSGVLVFHAAPPPTDAEVRTSWRGCAPERYGCLRAAGSAKNDV